MSQSSDIIEDIAMFRFEELRGVANSLKLKELPDTASIPGGTMIDNRSKI